MTLGNRVDESDLLHILYMRDESENVSDWNFYVWLIMCGSEYIFGII
jgi:hypothetical protein